MKRSSRPFSAALEIVERICPLALYEEERLSIRTTTRWLHKSARNAVPLLYAEQNVLPGTIIAGKRGASLFTDSCVIFLPAKTKNAPPSIMDGD